MKLLNYLKEKYDVTSHIDTHEDKSYTTLYIEFNNSYTEIHVEYNSRADWNTENDDGHGGFEVGYKRTNKAIRVHTIDYYKNEEQVNVSEDEFNNIETELNEQLQKYAS